MGNERDDVKLYDIDFEILRRMAQDLTLQRLGEHKFAVGESRAYGRASFRRLLRDGCIASSGGSRFDITERGLLRLQEHEGEVDLIADLRQLPALEHLSKLELRKFYSFFSRAADELIRRKVSITPDIVEELMDLCLQNIHLPFTQRPRYDRRFPPSSPPPQREPERPAIKSNSGRRGGPQRFRSWIRASRRAKHRS